MRSSGKARVHLAVAVRSAAAPVAHGHRQPRCPLQKEAELQGALPRPDPV